MTNYKYPLEDNLKDKERTRLKRKIFEAFYDRPKTRRMVHEYYGYYSGTICGIVDKMIKDGVLRVVRLGTCEYSGRRNCQYLSSNPDYFGPKEECS